MMLKGDVSRWCVCACPVASVVPDSCGPMVVSQAPLSVRFSWQDYWSWLPCPPPRDLPDPGIKSVSPALQAVSLSLSHQGVKVKVTQFCPTLCDPMDYTVHGILQARRLEWVAFPFSRGSSQSRD